MSQEQLAIVLYTMQRGDGQRNWGSLREEVREKWRTAALQLGDAMTQHFWHDHEIPDLAARLRAVLQ
jgi:hypothetical protein